MKPFVLGATVLAAFGAAAFVLRSSDAAPVAPLPRPAGVFAPDREFVILDPERMARVRVEVTIGGKPAAQVWEEAFGQLVALYDRDGDGVLSRTEAARLPSAFSLRQLLWGRSAPHTGQPIPWEQLDAAGTGKVGVADVARYYRAAGLGGATLAYGRSAISAPLSDALFRLLDADNNGTLEPAEWKVAADRLRTRDRNGDGLISASELLTRAAYPGVSGVGILLPPVSADGPVLGEGSPLVRLPDHTADTGWAARIVRLRDRNADGQLSRAEAGLAEALFDRLDTNHDGSLTPEELARWREFPPDMLWRVEAGAWPDGTAELSDADGQKVPRLAAAVNTVRLELRGDRGQIPAALTTARKRLLEQFADADRGNGVGLAELIKRSQYELQQLREVADRNGDARLSATELKAWQDVQDAVAAAHVLITVHDHGHGLFESLDTNHDGQLSVPELRAAANRAAFPKAGMTTLPHQLLAVASRGHPQHPLGQPPRRGPDWFRAMDRNGDGFVSREEFAGTAEQFDRIDRDHNGQIDPDEAEKALVEKSPSR